MYRRTPLLASLIAWIGLTASPTVIAAQSDELDRTGFRSSVCNIDSMSVSFKVDQAFEEPLVTSAMRWNAGPNTSEDCLSRLTHVWVKARTPEGDLTYIKLSPTIQRSGESFGATVTESPSWSRLFCASPRDGTSCSGMVEARRLYGSELKFEGFNVVTETLAITGLSRDTDRAPRGDDDPRPRLNVDNLLEDALAEVLDPKPKPVETLPEPEVALPTPEELAAREVERMHLLAERASGNVMTLLGSSLARYEAPANRCESGRSIANWVQVEDTCKLNFRSEERHNFLCEDDGAARPIRATRRADIDFSRHVQRISDIRVSNSGWAALTLHLNSELRTTEEGEYQSNRWQFTTGDGQLDDLKRLAASFATLHAYCTTDA
ncbi:MAG: hypothetical protein CMQ24_16800 [Gammaproteobacteria bacterium]|nr:hypothetical protein [Gammaproteobacteria bacterium]